MARCAVSGSYEPPPFIHCSTGRQVRIPWRTLLSTQDDLVMLLIDESVIDAPVRYEARRRRGCLPPRVRTDSGAGVVTAEPLEPGMATAVASRRASRGSSPRPAATAHPVSTSGGTSGTPCRRIARASSQSVHGYLSRDAYWSTGIPRDVLERALSNSLCFGLYTPDGDQAGFCRVVTDHATYGYLADVFVLPEHRGLGLGLWLVQCAVDHPELAGLRSWQLGTRDAHGIYERLGWRAADPARWMSRSVAASDIYG